LTILANAQLTAPTLEFGTAHALLAAVAAAARSAYETGQPAELPLPPEFADVALARAFRQLRGDPPNESPDELGRRLNVSLTRAGRVLPAMNVWTAPGTRSYSVRSAVAVRVRAAQPAGRSAPMTAMQRPPRPNSTSSAGW
jgi:hypothetical protein